MAEGEVQQAINEIREAADRLADIDIADVVAGLQNAATRLNDLLNDGGTTSAQDQVPAEEQTTDQTTDETEPVDDTEPTDETEV